jgi:large subunit ribosomal protein L4
MIIEDFNFDAPKTKDMLGIMKALKLDTTKTLFLVPGKKEYLYKSGRNLPKLNVMISDKAATYDLLNNKMILMQKSAVEPLCKSLLS